MRLSIETIQERIKQVHGDKVILVVSTYIEVNARASFIDKDYGLWNTTVKSVLRGRGNRLRYENERKISLKEIKSRLNKAYCDLISIIDNFYNGTQNNAIFIDKDYGEFKAIVNNVLRKKVNHPQRTLDNNIKKFGFSNPILNKEVKLKAITSSNMLYNKYHWKTNEELICQGSWEAKVVDYLNQNQIEFDWQPKTFTMPNSRNYTPDLFLNNKNKWIEIKGYMRKDAQEKWDWFKSQYPTAELWNEKVLKNMGIL